MFDRSFRNDMFDWLVCVTFFTYKPPYTIMLCLVFLASTCLMIETCATTGATHTLTISWLCPIFIFFYFGSFLMHSHLLHLACHTNTRHARRHIILCFIFLLHFIIIELSWHDNHHDNHWTMTRLKQTNFRPFSSSFSLPDRLISILLLWIYQRRRRRRRSRTCYIRTSLNGDFAFRVKQSHLNKTDDSEFLFLRAVIDGIGFVSKWELVAICRQMGQN